jgi:5'-deoxynucleotidase YfbR-like HD superfamily hydrolase
LQFDDETGARASEIALVHDMGEAIIGDITPSDGISPGKCPFSIQRISSDRIEVKHTREELALEFLACTIRPTNPKYADRILELWCEYEEGKTRAALLAKQMDKLECIQQAVIYEERTGKDMSDFMALEARITLPELKPLLDACLQKYDELKQRKQANIVVVFVSGIACQLSS